MATQDKRPVSLVIPARNAAATVRPCLNSVVPLLGHDGLTEILFVDDASTDATADIVREYPQVRMLRSDGSGPGAARNVGWRAAESPLIWFIDADCVADAKALHRLKPHLKAGPAAGVGGSYTNRRPDSLLATLIHEEIVARHGRMPRDVDFLATFNVLYRRDALDAVGGFAQAPRGQDVEFAYRLRKAGGRLRFDRGSTVAHFHPTCWTRYLWTQARHGYYRVWIYFQHPHMLRGDCYSGVVDHVQPLLAIASLAATPLVVTSLWWVFAVLLLSVALAQLPMTLRIFLRTRRLALVSFAAMATLRALFRAGGLVVGLVDALRATCRSNHWPGFRAPPKNGHRQVI